MTGAGESHRKGNGWVRPTLRLAAERWAAAATLRIGTRWGERFPFYYVAQYPKSGGTWLCRMMSDYLDVPFPQHSILPATRSCVIQHFGRWHPALRRVVYLHRDGRDVLVSLYFDRLRIARNSNSPGRSHVRRVYERLLGENYDPRDIRRHLPRFIEYEFRNPGRGSPLNWAEHIHDWLHPGSDQQIVAVRYEDLLDDGQRALEGLLLRVTGEAADSARVRDVVRTRSMLRATGRRPGQADPTQYIRKGIVGDWRNHFTREAAEVFDFHAGRTLVRLGYEQDAPWVGRYDYPVA